LGRNIKDKYERRLAQSRKAAKKDKSERTKKQGLIFSLRLCGFARDKRVLLEGSVLIASDEVLHIV
jgi:hypothetical protein